VVDSSGYIFAVGSSYSTAPKMTNGDKDIVIFKFKPSDASPEWVNYYGTVLNEEEGTGIAL
jgi:hypothetical protein